MKTVIKADIIEALREVGLKTGDPVMVHTYIEHSAVLENGERVWKAYETQYVDGEDFIDIGTAFEARYSVNKVLLGGAELKLMNQRELVDFAVEWIEKNRK